MTQRQARVEAIDLVLVKCAPLLGRAEAFDLVIVKYDTMQGKGRWRWFCEREA